jgi:glycosyltransferase involved in cell wall biosynthesis
VSRARVTRRPRILLLVTLAETGGAQTYVAALAAGLTGRFDVTVAAHGSGPLRGAAEAAGADFVALRHVRRPLSARDVLGLLELTRLVRRLRPDVVHASSSKAGALGRVAAYLAGVRVRVFTVHGWAFAAVRGPRSRLYRLADRTLRPLTTVTICVSERERTLGLAARTCDAERTVVIRTGIDAGPRPHARPDSEPPTIVSVGRLQAPKDTVTLLHALASLPSGFGTALLVGEGPERPGAEALIRRLGLAHSVSLLGDREDVPQLLAASQVFVLSTRSEGLPVSILEAMAAGLPVVATGVGGVPELVVDGETGLLVRPGDPAALAAALRRLLEDPELRRKLGAAGRARVGTHFTLDSFHEAHVAVYRRELAARGLPLPSP